MVERRVSNYMRIVMVMFLLFLVLSLSSGCQSSGKDSNANHKSIEKRQSSGNNTDLLNEQLKFTNEVHQQGINALTE